VENPEGNRTLGRPMRGWECNTKMNLKGVDGDMSLIGLAQYRDKWQELSNAVMTIRVP